MVRYILVTSIAILVACPLFADDKKPAFDMNKAMEAMAKHAEPGPHHKKLDPMIGDWTFKAMFTMDPSMPAMEMTGTSTRKWILDGRFMQDDAKGDSGMPFRGLGFNGYDNALKKYTASWMDSMTTSISSSTGEVDATGKVFTFWREEFNPMYGQKVKARDVIRVIDDNHHDMEMYTTPPGGKEFKSGHIKYERKK